MHSIRSSCIMFLRISPSPDVCDDNAPLARTKPIFPFGVK